MLKLDTTNEYAPAENIARGIILQRNGDTFTISLEPIRVLRIAHASLTPALRGRERGIASTFPQVQMEVITPPHWFESGVNVKTVPDDLFPVRTARTFFSKHMQLFAYDPLPIIRALHEHRPHIIDMDHEPYSIPCAEIITIRNRFAPGTPIVMQTAQNILKKYPPPFSFFERRALKQVSAAYMCSKTVREVLETKGFEKPMKIVPFGVDLEMFPFKERQTENVLTIGYVGRLLPAKGLLVLADALAKIKDLDWKLLIVGDGEERQPLEQKLSEYGLLGRTKFIGAVPYHETPEYFEQMDVLVVPTRTTKKIREQFGRVIVEAMASGVPVIGSTCGAIPEVIGNSGLIFEENNSQELAKQLERILTQRILRKNLSKMGRKCVEEKYTWEQVAKGIYELYRRVLS